MTRKKFAFAAKAALTLAAMVLFLRSPARYAESVRCGVSLWAVSVLPATFPFLFLTAVFTKTDLFSRLSRAIAPAAGRAFRISGAGGCAAVLSALSGYPVGAKCVADLAARRAVGQEERFRLACLATTTGPMFVVGVVGSCMAGSAAAGWLMLACHFLGVWIVGFFLRFTAKKAAPPLPPPPPAGGQADSLSSSVLSILYVGGSIALFYAFGQMAADLLPSQTPALVTAILRGLIEMTTGCSLFAPALTPAALAACCFFVTFGGLCVICQQAGFLSAAGVKIAPFLAVKLTQGAVSALLCYTLATLLL